MPDCAMRVSYTLSVWGLQFVGVDLIGVIHSIAVTFSGELQKRQK